MPLVPIAYPKRSNPARHTSDGPSRLINMYVEEAGEEGKSPLVLYGTEGLKVFADAGTGQPVRGALALDYVAYCVIGYQLFRMSPDGTMKALGTIAGQGHVTLSRNRHSPVQIAIVTETGHNYVLENDELKQSPDEDLISPNSVTFLNGYLVYSHRDGRITSTALDDALDVNALHYDTAEFHHDKLLRIITRGSELLAMGEESIEIWQPAAGEGLPFLRSSTIPKGCIGGATVQTIDGAALWVADDKTVRIARGYDPTRISTHSIERDIEKVSNPEEITSMVWTDRGHSFYSISHDKFTWVFDLTTGLWHERKSHNRKNWRCGIAFQFQGRKIFGDSLTGKIYEQDNDISEEAGEPISMRIVLPATHATPGRLIMNSLHIDAVPGVGAHTDKACLNVRVSKNGGVTFGNTRALSLGGPGEYQKRLKANRFGTSKEDGFVIEISSNDKSAKCITGIYADIEKIGV